MFIINCKNYQEISGDKVLRLITAAENVSKKHKLKIAIAPPQHLLALASQKTTIPILAQHLDNSKVGSTTGYVIPEIIKRSKITG